MNLKHSKLNYHIFTSVHVWPFKGCHWMSLFFTMWHFWWILICICLQRGDNSSAWCFVNHSGAGYVRLILVTGPPSLSPRWNDNTRTQLWHVMGPPIACYPPLLHTYTQTHDSDDPDDWVFVAGIVYREGCIHSSNNTSLGRTTRGCVVMTHAAAPRGEIQIISEDPHVSYLKWWILCSSNKI